MLMKDLMNFKLILCGSRDRLDCANFYNVYHKLFWSLKLKIARRFLVDIIHNHGIKILIMNNEAFIFSLKTAKQQTPILSKAKAGCYTIKNKVDLVGFCSLYLKGNEKNFQLTHGGGFKKCINNSLYTRNNIYCFSVEEYELFKLVKN